ncbi:MAG TPA: DUF222 domain-containing protein [Streptosporangiaceae bacterium]|nr:DUF222 domain-containing protein [Streptosporangiaceae bacterium]
MSIPVPTSDVEAMDMYRTGLSYLAAADPTAMAAQAQAEFLQAFEQGDAMSTAARAQILVAFTASQGYSADADYSPTSWLIHRTRVTKGAARGHLGWARRAVTHPDVLKALAEGTVVSESMARTICQWTDKLPEACRPAADEILIAAAQAGARQEDLAALAAEIYARSLTEDHDDQPGLDFEDRQVRIETTFEGAGVIAGDLTPECAAVVTAVLESLSAPAGAEDTRSREQRYHDALQEAMRRLAASGLLPERAGQPVKVWAHVSLAELRAMDDGSVLETEWVTEMRIRWSAHRAEAANGTGGDGGAWLDGDAARAVACDAAITPVVTGDVNPGILDDLVTLCLQLAGHGPRCQPQPDATPAGAPAPAANPDPVSNPDPAGNPGPAAEPAPAGAGELPSGLAVLSGMSREAIQRAIIGKAADLLSGPGGLASFLRTRQLGARLAGPSLPLDIGYASTVPAGIRNAVILRDKRCQWAGRCNQPASACQVHHVRHKANGGATSVKDCVLLCFFHHQVVIHRWGWTLVLNPDGTTTAWNPDKTKVLHSHSPPARAG